MSELDPLLDGVADPKQREALIKAFHELANGDPNSLPVHLALITAAQWRAAIIATAQLKRNTDALVTAERRWAARNEALEAREKAFEAAVQQWETQIRETADGCKERINSAATLIGAKTWQAAQEVEISGIATRWNKSIESQISKSAAASRELEQFAETVKKVKRAVQWQDLAWPVLCGLLVAAIGWMVIFYFDEKRVDNAIATIRAHADQQIMAANVAKELAQKDASDLTAKMPFYQQAADALIKRGILLKLTRCSDERNRPWEAVVFEPTQSKLPSPMIDSDGQPIVLIAPLK